MKGGMYSTTKSVRIKNKQKGGNNLSIDIYVT